MMIEMRWTAIPFGVREELAIYTPIPWSGGRGLAGLNVLIRVVHAFSWMVQSLHRSIDKCLAHLRSV